MSSHLDAAHSAGDFSTQTAPSPAANDDPQQIPALIEPLIALMREVSARELMPRFKHVSAEKKHDGSLVTEADRAVEAALAEVLPTLFDCPVLGEEMAEEAQKKIWREAEWCWCVDPLDGTSNFANGKRYFGMSVALMHHRRSVLGVVLDPNTGEIFHALRHGGAWHDGKRMKPTATKHLAEASVEVGRFKRLGRLRIALFENRPFRHLSMSGASVLQWCHMACGRVDAFLHAGEQPWDYAAGALILEEAGGRTATLHHDDYWKCDGTGDWSKSVIAARHPALFDEWKRWVRNHL
ncbi:MAG: inositol monophosphatase family protein [Betaproteobacteria bacterium]|nr:inositol monophosphatase family protein [Betaproteobacteria bacterium]